MCCQITCHAHCAWHGQDGEIRGKEASAHCNLWPRCKKLAKSNTTRMNFSGRLKVGNELLYSSGGLSASVRLCRVYLRVCVCVPCVWRIIEWSSPSMLICIERHGTAGRMSLAVGAGSPHQHTRRIRNFDARRTVQPNPQPPVDCLTWPAPRHGLHVSSTSNKLTYQ